VTQLEFDDLAHTWKLCLEMELLLDEIGEYSARAVFSMSEDDTRFTWRDMAEPVQQIRLSGMSTEAAKGMNLGAYYNLFTVNTHPRLAFHQASAQGPVSLVAHDHDMGFFAPKIMLEVMQDAPGVAHSRSRHNEADAFVIVNFPGLLRRDGGFQCS